MPLHFSDIRHFNMRSIKEALAFLSPIFDPAQLTINKERSIVLRLSKTLTEAIDENAARPILLTYTLDLVLRIHNELAERDATANGMPLEHPGERRAIYALLDLLVLEGIYPALSPGVDIPIERRARSFAVNYKRNANSEEGIRKAADDSTTMIIFKSIIEGLLKPINKGEYTLEEQELYKKQPWRRYKGVEGLVRERCQVDLISSCAELAFNPNNNNETRFKWQGIFTEITSCITTGALMPICMSLLHPGAPAWFRKPITKCLSLIPISRPYAVQNILELFLSVASSGNVAQESSSQLSIDALAKVSRLLSSVPSSIAAESYFSKVCPQLLELLDSPDLALQRSSAYVIAEFLGKQGSFVQAEIVDKIIFKFNPEKLVAAQKVELQRYGKNTSSALLDLEDMVEINPSHSPLVFDIPDKMEPEPLFNEEDPISSPTNLLISDSDLSSALNSIELLLSIHPTPLIPERIIAPILVPLWGLAGYAKDIGRSTWYNRVSGVLKSYFAVSLTQDVLECIQNNLTFHGTDKWEFAPGSSGGIEIRTKTARRNKGVNMELMDSRVEELLSIFDKESTRGSILNNYFLSIFRAWLGRNEVEPMKMLINVKILQEILANHGETIAKRPAEILQVIKSVLDEYVDHLEELKKPTKTFLGITKPSLGTLGQIVPDTTLGDIIEGGSEDYQAEHENRAETAAMALSLLSVLISSPETKLSETDDRLVTTLYPSLQYLSSASIDPNLKTLATNLTAMLAIHRPTVSTSTPTPLLEQQREKYETAISYIRDPLIPVRAHGLYILRELILDHAPIVNITIITRLLIGMVKDGDSYVYLNVIKCLSALTDRHSKTVTKLLIGAYIDDEDVLGVKTSPDDYLALDERLKIGEALLSTVQRLGQALVGEVAEDIGNGMITIISRRRTRTTPKNLEKKKALDSFSSKNENRDEEILDEDGNALTDIEKATRKVQARMVAGWDSTPNTEDLRIRTSALSILGSAVQTNSTGLGLRLIRETMDVSLSILTLEITLEAVILRRAAVVSIGAILRAVVSSDHEDTEGTVWHTEVWQGVVKERVADIRRVLGYVRVTDKDGMVREQARVVLENMDAVIQRRMLGGATEVETPAAGMAGLRVNVRI